MKQENSIKIFNDKKIRTKWDEEIGDYYYSVIDVVAVLTDSKNPSAYWRKLKQRLKKEQNEIVKKCHSLKMPSNDGKMRLSDVANTNNLISILDNIKSEYKDEFIDWLNQTRLEHLYELNNTTSTLLYYGDEGAVSIEVIIDKENETMWATQKTIASLFKVSKQNISYHLKDIFETAELDENSVVKEILTTAPDNKKYSTKFYNLDVIISVGYRVNSKNATQFRIWATKTLKEYMVKGFVLDDELLKNGTRFGKDYFENLLERIRAIRSSERRFNQKITDIYATSYDYNKNAEITRKFFATVQNKLIYAVSGKTAAEIIYSRSNSEEKHMGLTNWRNPNDKILLSDVVISKNYLNKHELLTLNSLVDGFLTLAENRARNNVLTSMNDWKDVLDAYISLNQLPILVGKGNISSEDAKKLAKEEYEKYKIIQDKIFESDFDKLIDEIKRLEGN